MTLVQPETRNTRPTVDPHIEELISTRATGLSLEAPMYTSQAAFDLDVEAIFANNWILVGTDAEIPDAGDYITVEIGKYSIIVTRDDDEEVRALHNVCRHRGARILDDAAGSVGRIVCGYHHWTYGMDGKLLHAEAQAPSFDPTCFSLKSVAARSVAGLIYICISPDSVDDFDEFVDVVTPYLEPHRLRNAKVAKQTDLIEKGNWKLTIENNRECYHCDGHPELMASVFPLYGYDLSDLPERLKPAYERFLEATRNAHADYTACSLPFAAVEELDSRTTGFRIEREPLDMAGESMTMDGTAASQRLLADFPSPRLGRLGMHVQPNTWLHVMADHAVVFVALPISPGETLVRTTWLVHEDAQEGLDYNLDDLVLVWERTNAQDAAFVERAHKGIESPAYVPGPYGPSESQVEAFVNWYTGRLRDYLAR